MKTSLFQGELIRLVAEDPAVMAKAFYKWERDSEYMRLLDSDPPVLWSQKKIEEWIQKESEKSPWEGMEFSIRTLHDDQLIGFVGLGAIKWIHGDALVGIGLGERDYWGNGYGTDAMQVILRYAFTELNLYRLTLEVFEYNPRAIQSYLKAGFKEEGRIRKSVLREGTRWDVIVMGILREDWVADTLRNSREKLDWSD